MSEADLTPKQPQYIQMTLHLAMLPSGTVRVVARIHRYGLMVEVDGADEESAVALALSQMAADVLDWSRT